MNDIKNELRARCLAEGPDSLTEQEKLLLLMSYSERGDRINVSADRIAAAYGSFRSAADSDPAFLKKECGINTASAALLTLFPQLSRRCAITGCGNMRLDSADAAKRFFLAQLRSCRTETLIAAATDGRFRVISAERLSTGNSGAVASTGRKAAEFALRHNAVFVFIAHNHTSGTPQPSENDMSATLKIRAALGSLDIILADHIITAPDGSALSMRETAPAGYFAEAEGYTFSPGSITTGE
ncbi:MAG: JAB domain-containing protein [Ruminococcus sp.]|nr:JAB domain-containing protein [Ruminococcus sp.]